MKALKLAVENHENPVFPNAMIAGRRALPSSFTIHPFTQHRAAERWATNESPLQHGHPLTRSNFYSPAGDCVITHLLDRLGYLKDGKVASRRPSRSRRSDRSPPASQLQYTHHLHIHTHMLDPAPAHTSR